MKKYCQTTGQFILDISNTSINTENYVTKQRNAHAQNVFNPILLITHNILHTYVFCFCCVILNTPLMHGYGTVYVYISLFPARCQVTLPLRLLKFSCRILKFTCYFGSEEFNMKESTKMTLLLLQLCTVQAPNSWNLDFHSLMGTADNNTTM